MGLITHRGFRRFLAATPFFLLAALSYFRVFDLYELQTYDWRSQLRGQRPVSDQIVLIDIWDDTLKALGAWPFDRAFHADLIRILKSQGVRMIGFDILFVEPRAGDEEVAQAAREAGNVYFAYAFQEVTPKKFIYTAKKLLAPLLEPYQAVAAGTGHVNAKADLDGKRRRTYPAIEKDGRLHFQLAFQMGIDALGLDSKKAVFERGALRMPGGGRIPLDDEGCFIVSYAGRWEKTFKHYSYYDVMAATLEKSQGQKPRIALEELRGKICLVGLTSLGSHDTSPIPIQSVYPMAGLYANVLNDLLLRDFIIRWSRWTNVGVVLFLMLTVAFLCMKMRPLQALGAVFLLVAFYAALATVLFVRWGLWADLFYPLVATATVYAASALGRSLNEMRKMQLLESELRIASQIQRSFLPENVPAVRGLEMAVYMKPAKAVGGDLYTFISLGEGKVGVMIGDVSGKGTPAALFMAKSVSEFKYAARDKTDPALILSSLNQAIASESTGGLFLTASYGIMDADLRTFTFANAGHLPAVWVDQRSGQATLLQAAEGMPIGVLETAEFSNQTQTFSRGDVFAFYSDGVSEARNRRAEEYGMQALLDVLSKNRLHSAEQILKNTLTHLNEFVGRAPAHDDLTLIVVKTKDSYE